MLIRPVAQSDQSVLLNLLTQAGVGMTTLPQSQAQLERRIIRSEASFAGGLALSEQGYVFVLEDTAKSEVVGICAIEAAVGLKEPWYNYRVGVTVHASEELQVYSRHDTLFLSNDHTGSTELCSLFLHPDYRINRNGTLLSKSRFLFLAEFAQCFAPVVVAEMRGVSDQNGYSPFWEALGRHFFSIDFAEADYLTGIGKKAFVAELMPKYPVYVDLLPHEAQAVIGRTHAKTQPARALLESEGFRYEGYIDIFDAGPTMQAYTTDIRAVRESRVGSTLWVAPDVKKHFTVDYLVANTLFEGFRAILVKAEQDVKHVFPLTQTEATRLNVKEGDPIRFVAVSPTRNT